MATFTADKNAAYHGRLGQQDAHYTDPNFGGTVGSHDVETKTKKAKAAPEPEVEETEEEAEEEAEEETEKEEADVDVDVDVDVDIAVEDLTVEQLKDELDGWGVEYGSGDRKADLQEKLRAARGE